MGRCCVKQFGGFKTKLLANPHRLLLNLKSFDCFNIIVEMASMEKPDERAVMTYVSSYYHAFSSSQQVFKYMITLT